MMKHKKKHNKKQVKRSTLLMEMAEDIMDIAVKARRYRKIKDKDREEID